MTLSTSILARLESQHQSIAEIISGVDDAWINFHPAPGKWSIHDNIAHLARYNVVFQERMKTILAEYEPSYPRYNADADSEFPEWQKKKTDDLLKSISTEREKLFLFVKSISENYLKRVGVHPKFGRLTIIDWLNFFLLHEAHHIFTIFQLKNDLGIVT